MPPRQRRFGAGSRVRLAATQRQEDRSKWQAQLSALQKFAGNKRGGKQQRSASMPTKDALAVLEAVCSVSFPSQSISTEVSLTLRQQL